MIYDDMRKVARDVLREFAQGRTEYVAVTPGDGPGDDPGPATETPTLIDAVARGVKFKYVDGTTIVASDMQITMPAGGVEPSVSGFVRVDGTRYKIRRVDPVPPAGMPVIYRVFFGK